jgi:hypothetical protein
MRCPRCAQPLDEDRDLLKQTGGATRRFRCPAGHALHIAVLQVGLPAPERPRTRAT